MGRLEKARRFLAKAGAGCAVLKDESSIRYLCGFSGDSSLLFFDERRAVLITDGRYTQQAQKELRQAEVLEYKNSLWQAVAGLVQAAGDVVFDGDAFTYNEHCALAAALGPGRRLCSIDLEPIRQIKEPEEIVFLRQAAAIEDEALQKLLKELRPGLSERQVAAKLEYHLAELGSEKPSFDTIAVSGPRSALPHGRPTERVLEAGEFLTLDFGAVRGGYHGDITRTFVIGKASPWQKEVYASVLAAQKKGIEAARAGRCGKEVDGEVRGLLTAAGYGAYFNHGTGHGAGLKIHELPHINSRGDTPLAAGMVFSVEPGLYFPGRGGLRIEDSVLLTERGAEPLTKFTKELIEVT